MSRTVLKFTGENLQNILRDMYAPKDTCYSSKKGVEKALLDMYEDDSPIDDSSFKLIASYSNLTKGTGTLTRRFKTQKRRYELMNETGEGVDIIGMYTYPVGKIIYLKPCDDNDL